MPVMVIVIMVVIMVLAARFATKSTCIGGHARYRPLNHLIELAAIQPYAPALGAIVNFYPLALRHLGSTLQTGQFM
jgi:hypothetical protein